MPDWRHGYPYSLVFRGNIRLDPWASLWFVFLEEIPDWSHGTFYGLFFSGKSGLAPWVSL